MSDYTESFRQDLAEVTWRDLRIHLQRDAIILVEQNLDLISVATAVAEDDKSQVEAWISAGKLGKPSQSQLEAWENELAKPFRMLIVQPYILAQQVQNA